METYDWIFVGLMLACLMLLGFAVYEAATHPQTVTITVVQ